MKCFTVFRACCGGATVESTAVAGAPLKSPRNSNASSWSSSGRLTKVNPAHWKPALSAISEDSVVVSDNNDIKKHEATVRSQKKASEKERSSATARSPRHADDDSKDSMLTALPVFSPTPFLF